MANNTSSTSVIYSNKGGVELVHDDFIFKLNKRTPTKIYWKCKVTNCSARIHTDNNNNLLNKTSEHNHLLEPELLQVKRFRSALKERVVNETVPIQKIYDEEMVKANFPPEVLACVPLPQHIRMIIMVKFLKISSLLFLEPGLNQARRKFTPALPTSNSFDIPDGYQTTASGETFLI